ncbi:hypothetical protein J2X65_003005 [Ancylobacter sp. 3268]|nr:hypothetical protein [Ancylobacter sp. 3268]
MSKLRAAAPIVPSNWMAAWNCRRAGTRRRPPLTLRICRSCRRIHRGGGKRDVGSAVPGAIQPVTSVLVAAPWATKHGSAPTALGANGRRGGRCPASAHGPVASSRGERVTGLPECPSHVPAAARTDTASGGVFDETVRVRGVGTEEKFSSRDRHGFHHPVKALSRKSRILSRCVAAHGRCARRRCANAGPEVARACQGRSFTRYFYGWAAAVIRANSGADESCVLETRMAIRPIVAASSGGARIGAGPRFGMSTPFRTP